jgi:hypothetical protein
MWMPPHLAQQVMIDNQYDQKKADEEDEASHLPARPCLVIPQYPDPKDATEAHHHESRDVVFELLACKVHG